MKILVVIGTRPEAIKLAPLVRLLRRERSFKVTVSASAQHRELLDLMLRAFRLRPDSDLGLMRPGQTPRQVLARSRAAVGRLLERERPDLLVVQGDTTSALGAALAAKERGVAVAHVEAGLRTGDPRNPWPEENNRVRIDALSALMFAPTKKARQNLLREGLDAARIFVTGNTGVDALVWALRRLKPGLKGFPKRGLVAVTLHRRESFGRPLAGILSAIRRAAELEPGLTWVLPVHPNPRVGRAARRLLKHPRIRLVRPLGYLDFVRLMKSSEFLVTDSGGIQEEAPTLKKPVLVVREKTERPELIGRGGVLAGTSRAGVLRWLLRFASGRRPRPPRVNPFGDGRASERIVRALRAWAEGAENPKCYNRPAPR